MQPPYGLEATDLLLRTNAQAVYLLVLGGDRGSAGCPVMRLEDDPERTLWLYRELHEQLKQCVAQVEADIERFTSGRGKG